MIWIPMLPGDSRSDVDMSVIDDRRVTQFWDGDHVVGGWLADHRTGDLERGGGVVWDAFLGFSPSARWRARPTGLLTAGSTVIDNTDALERDFLPVLLATTQGEYGDRGRVQPVLATTR